MNETRRCPQCDAPLSADAPAGLCPKCLLAAGFESDADSHDPGPTDASPGAAGFVPPSPQELGTKFPQLEILELVGRGGMGAVYKARQPGLDRLVALKILPPHVAADPAFQERFSREARALARLGHPNIVAVFDSGRAGELYYFLMEYVDGVNLRETIHAGNLSADEALAIVPQICDALQYAHDEGIVHRDIKPENILLDKKGRVKIADFGLAKLLGKDAADEGLTHSHQVMGTLRYMAPEQMKGTRSVDHRADIFSLGVVFYELLTGDVPAGKFDPPSKRVQVDVRLDEVVLRALEQEPDKRYQRAADVKTDVEAASRVSPGGYVMPAKPINGGPPPAASSKSSSGGKAVLLIVALVLLIACLPGLVVGVGILGAATFWLRAYSEFPPEPAMRGPTESSSRPVTSQYVHAHGEYDEFAVGEWEMGFPTYEPPYGPPVGVPNLPHSIDPARDMIIRAEIQGEGALWLRTIRENGYFAWIRADAVGISKVVDGETTVLSEQPWDTSGGVELAFAAVGNRLLLYVDGGLVLDVVDDDLSVAGPPAYEVLTTSTTFHDIEVMRLDDFAVSGLLPSRETEPVEAISPDFK